jgi:aspartate/methionine/tyrosine aminotransferase
MDYKRVEYIDWFREKFRDVKYDLATSGMHSVSLSDLDIQLEDLDLGKTLFYGHPQLVGLISEMYGVDKKEVLITSGSTHANFLMCSLLLNEGDEVIIEHPVYTPLYDTVAAFKTSIKSLNRKFEEGYIFNVDDLNEMASKKTRMLIFTNLHNPSGTIMDNDTFKAVSDIAEDNEIYVLADEVYRDFILDGGPPPFSTFTQLGISTCSLSKFYGSGALRVGWALCQPQLVDKARKLNDYILAANSCSGEHLAAMILKKRDWFVHRVKKIMESNFPVINNWINERDDLEWVAPKYGFIGFPRLNSQIDTMKLTEDLLQKCRTMISPGRFFGCENHIRLGFGGEKEMLIDGLATLGSVLDEIG